MLDQCYQRTFSTWNEKSRRCRWREGRGGGTLGSIASLGYKILFVKDDDGYGGDGNGVLLGLHCFDMHGGRFEMIGKGFEGGVMNPSLSASNEHNK